MSDQVKYTNRLQGSRVLVVGGSSGIGFCVAEACLEYGALVAIASSNQSRVDSAVSGLQSSYPSAKSRIHGLVVDLSKAHTLEDELKKLFESTKQALGGEKLDHVVFTAGDALSTIPLSEMTMEKVTQAGQVRFFAPLMIAKFLPTYIHQTRKSSYTITTGSVSEKPIPNWSVVGSYAGGLHSMVRNLALDLKPLRVNGVSPGVVDTELWKMDKEEKEKLLKEFAKKMATGAPGQPEHVAESFLSCLRDENLDGTMLRTDGGSFLL